MDRNAPRGEQRIYKCLATAFVAFIGIAASPQPSQASWDYQFPITEHINWVNVGGQAVDISVAANGRIAIVGIGDNQIYAWGGRKIGWELLPRGQSARALALPPVGTRVTYVGSDQRIYFLRPDKKGWTAPSIPGAAVDVAYSPLGQLFASINGVLHEEKNGSFSPFSPASPTHVFRIAAEPSGDIWVIREDMTIHTYVKADDKWVQRPGKAKDIAASTRGDIWMVGMDSAPHTWNGAHWVKRNGSVVVIAVEPTGQPIAVVGPRGLIDHTLKSPGIRGDYLKNDQVMDYAKFVSGSFKSNVAAGEKRSYPVPAGFITSNHCGAVGQPACTTSKAWYRGPVKAPKPSSRAFVDLRKGGEWWECPANRPRRTLYAVTDHRACATHNILGEKLSHATYRGPSKNPKPKGSFVDIGRQEYWSCPSGFGRNLNPVNNRAACSWDNPLQACDGSNIASKGSCYKKGECGNEGQRPCLIVERFPSCKHGLSEDFLDAKCITKKMAQCLTFARGLRLVKNSPQAKMMKIGGEIFEHSPTGMMFKEISSAISAGMSDMAKKQKKQLAAYKAGGGDTKNIIYKVEKLITDIESKIPEIMRYAKKATTNSDKLLDILSSDSACSDSAAVTGKKLQAIMGKPDPKVMKAELDFLDGLFIKTANAATGDHFFLTFGVGAELDLIVEGALGITVATDFLGKWGLFFDKSVGFITNVAGSGGLSLGFYPKANLNTFTGKGWAISGSAGPPSKAIGVGVSFIINDAFNDLQGFEIDLAVGAGVIPVDISITRSWSDTIVKTK